MSDKIAYASPCGRGGSMTHEEAVRKSAVIHQIHSADYHAAYAAHRDQGREYLASLYAQWAAEESALARALMRIEVDET